MMKKVLFYLCLSLCIALVGPGGVTSAWAGSPWQWLFSLKHQGKDQPPVLMPTGVYIDVQRDRYYVVDPLAKSIHSYDQTGKYLNTFNPEDKLSVPYDMTRDGEGVLLVIEKGRNTLTEVDLKARKMTPRKLKIKDRPLYPDRVSMSGGNVFILDKFSGDVVRFDRTLTTYRNFSCTDCEGFIDFKVKSQAVWALEKNNNKVFQFDSSGKVVKRITLDHEMDFPFAIEVGSSGLLYILDRHKGEVVVFDQRGRFKYSFLSKGHSRGRLYYPEDLTFDPWGRLCVVDSGNGRVEVFGR